MELIEGSEMSAIVTQTPGNYPKENILHIEQGESLKSRIFTSKFVGTGPSSYAKRIYWAVVSQRLRNNDLEGFQRPNFLFYIKPTAAMGANQFPI